MHKTKKAFVGVVLIICLLVIARYSSGQQTFIESVSDGEILVEGVLVFRGTKEATISHVYEKHDKDTVIIEYPNRSYSKCAGHYYVDNGEGMEEIDISTYGLQEIEEMFCRMSVLSDYVQSNLKVVTRYKTRIPEPFSTNEVECICEEYRKIGNKKAGEETLRIYYIDEEVFAIRARIDDRFTFYLTEWGHE